MLLLRKIDIAISLQNACRTAQAEVSAEKDACFAGKATI
jgi:hypothetical protein